LMMTLTSFLEDEGHSWKYLPLEDSRKEWLWRAIAIAEQDYRITDDRAKTADLREAAFIRNSGRIEKLFGNVFQNPRIGHKDSKGNTVIPPLPFSRILEWAKDHAKQNRFLILDPLAQVEFSSRNQYEEQAELMRGLLGIIADTSCTLIVNMHTTKTTDSKPLSLGSVQGSADFTRLAHTILLFDAHDFKSSTIELPFGGFEKVSHNRTLTVAAVRNAPGWAKIAFSQSITGPVFTEHGIIKQD
jgi:hypothetical protein